MKDIKSLLEKNAETDKVEDIKEYSFWLGRLYGIVGRIVKDKFPLEKTVTTYQFVKNLDSKTVEKSQEMARVLIDKYGRHLDMEDKNLNQSIAFVMGYEGKKQKVDGVKLTLGGSYPVL